VDCGSAVNFGTHSRLCLSWCSDLGSKRNLDHRSFFSLSRYVNDFIHGKLFLFLNEAYLNSGVRLLLELHFVIVIKHVVFFTICAKLTVAFTFTFEPLHFCFWMWLWFQIWTKILADQQIWWQKCTGQWICIPLFTPLYKWCHKFCFNSCAKQDHNLPLLPISNENNTYIQFVDWLETWVSRTIKDPW